MRRTTQTCRIALLLALITACATGGEDSDASAPGFADSSLPGTPDASLPGTPDASLPGTPDAMLPGTPDAMLPVEAIITHSTNTTVITALNTISCNATNLHSDNSYYRVFDLSTFGITSDYNISKISIGIETALAGAGGTQPVNVRLHTLNGALLLANLTQIGTTASNVADTAVGLVMDIPVTGVAPAGSTLVVEFNTPDGQAAGHSLFVGSNTVGQTGPSYLKAVDCATPEPLDMAGLGFPNVHIVLTVTGTHTP